MKKETPKIEPRDLLDTCGMGEMPDTAATVTVKIPFLPWTGCPDLEIQVPLDTPEQWRLRAAVEIAHKSGANLDRASLDRARLDGARLDHARLVGISLVGASLDRASLVGARLDRASLDRASLVGASLDGASLDGASLDGASLDGASLVGASLVGASLDLASLVGTPLDGASLDRASLIGARLDHASLVGTSLDHARLDRASLVGARLDLAILDGTSLVGMRNDFWDVLLRAPTEVPGLLAALREGRIDGTTYSGECACLAGTIANLRNVDVDDLGFADAARPIERWFLGIGRGDRPETNRVSAITEGWILEFQALIGAAP